MRLRSLIESRPGPGTSPRTPATVATVATHRRHPPSTVAEVASVAASGEPNLWLVKMRAGGLNSLTPARWTEAADALEAVLQAGVVDEVLHLGWDAREIIGVQAEPPHDHPSRAGLIYSLKPGDTVCSVRPSGCVIVDGQVRHIWRRVPLSSDGSIVMPWELPQ